MTGDRERGGSGRAGWLDGEKLAKVGGLEVLQRIVGSKGNGTVVLIRHD